VVVLQLNYNNNSLLPMTVINILLYEVNVTVEIKLSLCLTKHHAMKTYCGVDV
jgi:hypothetical protein